jgi:peptidoglycan hydrolase-like protein with peptidoglycan-binding domain
VQVRRPLVWAVSAALSGLALTAAFGHPSGHRPPFRQTHGYDVSWPQCSGATAVHLPAGQPSYVILGLTHGAGHTANPCLGSQLAWARSRGVKTGAYLVASYPTPVQRRLADHGPYGACHGATRCRLHNDGAAQATDALATLRANGLGAPRVWIDVEFRHTYPWSGRNLANAAVIQGIVRGLRAARMPMGVYTTAYMWHAIVGGYRLQVPNWLPVGHGGPRQALGMCGTTATGGVTWLAQYTRALDEDLTCPVLDPVPGHHGKLWRFRRSTQKLFSRGAAVRAIQRRLHVPVSGQFGPVTSTAVARWQRSKGLQSTGEITPVDWRALGAYRTRGGHPYGLSKIAR